jgi:predicted transcriptional regulator
MIIPIVATTLGASSALASRISSGLESGKYERIGGVIRDSHSKQTVAWLRSLPDRFTTCSTGQNGLDSLLRLNAATSILDLSITGVGFALVMQRLDAVEQKLVHISKLLEGIGRKIDLSFCANLRAAVELARTAFAMQNEQNRRVAAAQAINRFLEAGHLYLALLDQELDDSSAVGPLFSALVLASVGASRCYLELNEVETAWQSLRDCAAALGPRIDRYCTAVVHVNPTIFLHPQFAGQITLERLANLMRRHRPRLTEGELFEELREQLWQTASQNPGFWAKKLPKALWSQQDGEKKIGPFGIDRSRNEMFERLLPRLPEAFDQVEHAYDWLDCVQGFAAELQYLAENKISYAEWRRIEKPPVNEIDSLICLLPKNSELLADTDGHIAE